MKIMTQQIRDEAAVLQDIIDCYKEQSDVQSRDWTTYEREYEQRLRAVPEELIPLVEQAILELTIIKRETRGAKSKLSLFEKVITLLLQKLFQKANRPMAAEMPLLAPLAEAAKVSYKTIERIYSDQEVQLALHNLLVLMLRRKDVDHVHACGDATGYMLTVKENYETQSKKLKQEKNAKRTKCAFTFALLDLDTNLYIAYGSSFRSEKAAYQKAMNMVSELGITLDSIRLDRYYSYPSYARELTDISPGVNLYLIPKTNSTVRGPWSWKRAMHRFVTDPIGYLGEYFKRNRSKSSFAADKRRTGWTIAQRLEERVSTAVAAICTLHNLAWLGVD